MSSATKKRSNDWSCGVTPTCRSMPSPSAETAYWYQQERIRTWIKFCNKWDPAKSSLFREEPWNFAAPLSKRRTLAGLWGWKTGQCGRYHSPGQSTSKQSFLSILTSSFCPSHSLSFGRNFLSTPVFYRHGVQVTLTELQRKSSFLTNCFYRRPITYWPDIGFRRDMLCLSKSSDL